MDQGIISKLVRIGLSRTEANIYLWILGHSPSTVNDIASAMNMSANAVYRFMKALQSKGLVRFTAARPLTAEALPPSIAIPAFVRQKTESLVRMQESVVEELKNARPQEGLGVEVFFGKQEGYEFSRKLLNSLKHELLVISTGEALPARLFRQLRKLILRGIDIRLIVHKYDESNISILERFRKAGMKVKHYPDEGFHMVIYDGKSVLMTVDDPENSDRRINIYITSKGLAEALREYFNHLWSAAMPV